MDHMTPGKFHQMLATHAGNWERKTTYWMRPDTDPKTSEGETLNSMIRDDRHLQSKQTFK